MLLNALLLLAAAYLPVSSDALILTVEPYHVRSGEECVFERVEKDNKLGGSFEVVSGAAGGGPGAVYLHVTGPSGEAHFSSEKAHTSKFTVMAPAAGLYKVCLVNKDREEKSVALNLRVGDDLFQTIAKQEHITPLETEITQLSDGISRIEDEQQYMWAREKYTAETNASTNARVLWFSVGEAVVLLGLGAWWVVTLRSFFERKGKA